MPEATANWYTYDNTAGSWNVVISCGTADTTFTNATTTWEAPSFTWAPYSWAGAQRTAGLPHELTPEERTVQERRRQQAEESRRQANELAEELLRSALTPEQIQDLEEYRAFTVTVLRPDGTEREYRIHRGQVQNVIGRDRQGRPCRYCIHPSEGVPDADAMLAQKLLLETDEEAFLRVAHVSLA